MPLLPVDTIRCRRYFCYQRAARCLFASILLPLRCFRACYASAAAMPPTARAAFADDAIAITGCYAALFFAMLSFAALCAAYDTLPPLRYFMLCCAICCYTALLLI